MKEKMYLNIMKISKEIKLQFKFVNVWFVITKFVDFCLLKETGGL